MLVRQLANHLRLACSLSAKDYKSHYIPLIVIIILMLSVSLIITTDSNTNSNTHTVSVKMGYCHFVASPTLLVSYTKWSFCTQSAIHLVHKMNNKLIHWITT